MIPSNRAEYRSMLYDDSYVLYGISNCVLFTNMMINDHGINDVLKHVYDGDELYIVVNLGSKQSIHNLRNNLYNGNLII